MTENEINEQIEEQAQMMYAQHDPELATQLSCNIGAILDGNKNADVAVALAVTVARFASTAPRPAITTGATLRIALRMATLTEDCFEDDEGDAPSGQLH